MTSPKQRKKRALARRLIETEKAAKAKTEKAPKKASEKPAAPAAKKPAKSAPKSSKKAQKPAEDSVEPVKKEADAEE